MSRRLIVAPATIFALIVCLIARPAEAQLVTDNGTTIFYDGFESDTPGTQPTAPVVGTYSQFQPGNPLNAGVYGPASGGPGAAVGSNYLHMFRPDSNSNAYILAGYSQPVATGDDLKLSEWVWVDHADTAAFFSGFNSADISTRVWMETTGAPGATPGTYRIQIGQGGAGADLANITFTPEKWQLWTMDWVVGSNQVTIGVDGVTETRTVSAGPLSTPIDTLRQQASNFPTTFYLDGPKVPEPSSLVLLGLGVASAGLWQLRRRK